jgi:hypothetical protein
VTGSKITALVLDWVVQDLVGGFDSPDFEVAGPFSKCAFAGSKNHCPCFLGQFAGGIFYPPGRFSSERIEIEGDIGDRE